MAQFASPPAQPLWARPASVALVLLVMALLKLWVAASTDLVPDEGYYTLWSLHLAPSYFDHPPAVAWLIALGRAIAGSRELGVRLPAILCDIVVAAAIYRIGVLLFHPRVGALAAIWHSVSVAAGLGFIMTPDAPLVLAWTLVLWAVAEALVSQNPAWWLAAGLFGGLGLDSKLTALLLAPGLLLYLLSSRDRRSWLGRWQTWAAVLVALAVFSPVLLWNAGNDWVTFWFQGRRVVASSYSLAGFLANFGELVAGQALAVGPPLVVFALAAAVALATGRGGRAREGLALTLLTPVPLLAYFFVHAMHSRVEANWPLPIWPGLTLAAAWAALAAAGGWQRFAARAGAVVQLGLEAILVAIILLQAVLHPFPPVDFDRTRDLHGWRNLFAEINTTAKDKGARWVANASEYDLVGELAAYSAFAGAGLAVHQIDDPVRYRFRGPFDPGGLGWPALYVASVADPAAPVPPDHYFGSAELVGIVARRRGDEVLAHYQLYLVSAPTEAFLDMAGR